MLVPTIFRSNANATLPCLFHFLFYIDRNQTHFRTILALYREAYSSKTKSKLMFFLRLFPGLLILRTPSSPVVSKTDPPRVNRDRRRLFPDTKKLKSSRSQMDNDTHPHDFWTIATNRNEHKRKDMWLLCM